MVIFLVGAVFFSMWYFLSLYLQDVLRYGPLRAGLAFLPMGIAIIVGAQVTSRAMPRTGIRPLLLAGTALVTGGFFWLSRIGPGSHYWGAVFGPGVIISLALGVLFTPWRRQQRRASSAPKRVLLLVCSTRHARSAVRSASRSLRRSRAPFPSTRAERNCRPAGTRRWIRESVPDRERYRDRCIRSIVHRPGPLGKIRTGNKFGELGRGGRPALGSGFRSLSRRRRLTRWSPPRRPGRAHQDRFGPKICP